MAIPPLSTGAIVVFALIFVALVLFVTEALPTDVTAVGLLVTLYLLRDWTRLSLAETLSGFASPATITVVAMYILSEGVQRTGVVDRLGAHVAAFTGKSEKRLLGATVGLTGPTAGIINNTPVVAVFIPMISGLAERAGLSRSTFLLPLSYAAMLGGTLTLVGTSTNILASDLSRTLLDHPIGMFEFTPLGVLVFLVGAAYLLTVAPHLIPERVPAAEDLTERFEVQNYLARVGVPEGSDLVGRPVDETLAADADVRVVQIGRGEDVVTVPSPERTVEAGDVLTLSGSADDVDAFVAANGLRRRSRVRVDEDDLHRPDAERVLAELVLTGSSEFVGETPDEARLREWYDTTVLAVRRGDELFRTDVDDVRFESGDVLLVQTTPDALGRLREGGDAIVSDASGEDPTDVVETAAERETGEETGREELPPLSPKTPLALGIVAGVIGVAALGLAPIVIAALGGVVLMVATGCVTTAEAYDAVSWRVFFLLAGVLPLGLAMRETGGAEFIAGLLVSGAAFLPAVALLALFYLLTGLLANVITPVASVVLMIPVAVDTAQRVGGEPFSFLLAVMFAASAAFMTPIGYQTNLMVYGPGGYTFTDYLRVGGPLQLILTVVTALGIAAIWGV